MPKLLNLGFPRVDIFYIVTVSTEKILKNIFLFSNGVAGR